MNLRHGNSCWVAAFSSLHSQHEVLLLLRLLISTRFKLRSGFKPNVISFKLYVSKHIRTKIEIFAVGISKTVNFGGFTARLWVEPIVYLRAYFTCRAIFIARTIVAYVEFSAHHLRRLPTFDKMPALLSKYQLGHQNFMSVNHGQKILLSAPNIPYQSYISNLSQLHIKV